MPTDALHQYMSVLQQFPLEENTWYSAGYVHLTLGEMDLAGKHFATALMLSKAKFPLAAEGMGTVHFSEGRLLESLPYFFKAFNLQPDRITTAQNLANALGKVALDLDSSFLERAASMYVNVLGIDPYNADAANKLILLRKQLCDWRHFDEDFRRVAQATAMQLSAGGRISLSPFNALTLPFQPEDLLSINSAHCPPHQPIPNQVSFPILPMMHKAKVGFLSADLRDHPVGRDLAVIFRSLSSYMKVYAYAINQPSKSDSSTDTQWLRSIEFEVTSLKHVGAMGDLEAARTMVSDGLHLLVDVMGYTRGNRKGILAMQPAASVVSFKGYMSTTGAHYLSLATDPSTSPPELVKTYTEQFVCIHQLFFISGHRDNHPQVARGVRGTYGPQVSETLAALGIPDDKFVFCSFNALYKVDHTIFHSWMRILKSTTTKAILWLSEGLPLELVLHKKFRSNAIISDV